MNNISETRNYTCPKCKTAVHAMRIGDTSSWLVVDLDKGEPTKDSHGCGYVGPVPMPETTKKNK